MGTLAKPAIMPTKAHCLARQPILAADEHVIGYELLFREGPEDHRFTSDGEAATCTIIDTLTMVGLDVICDDGLAFINCNRETLTKEFFGLLTPNKAVFEIQANVTLDQSIVEACQRIKEAGSMVALDQFKPNDARASLATYADYIKVDVKMVPASQCAAMVAAYGNQQCQMLAYKVESWQDFMTAKRNGFTLFQGYFFRHPERLRLRAVPVNQVTCLRLLQAVSRPRFQLDEIEELLKREPSLCYRLLRYLNSPMLGLSCTVSSVRHALNLLGERESIRWVRMATTLAMGHGKCSDLVLSSLVRARFCELLAPRVKQDESQLFLLGMLSLMDAILEVPIGVLVEGLRLAPELKNQLISGKTGNKTQLSPVYSLMVACEAGNWEVAVELGKQLGLSLYNVAGTYNEAMRWAHEVTSSVRHDGK